MTKRAFSCPTPSVVVFGLLLLGVVGAAAADEGPERPAAATSTCDKAPTLRGDDLVEWGLVSLSTEEACHGWVSCQPNYPACTDWSPFYGCGAPSCIPGSYDCLGCDEESCPIPPNVWALHSERFRVCFDQFHNACTEWQVHTVASCDVCDE